MTVDDSLWVNPGKGRQSSLSPSSASLLGTVASGDKGKFAPSLTWNAQMCEMRLVPEKYLRCSLLGLVDVRQTSSCTTTASDEAKAGSLGDAVLSGYAIVGVGTPPSRLARTPSERSPNAQSSPQPAPSQKLQWKILERELCSASRNRCKFSALRPEDGCQ